MKQASPLATTQFSAPLVPKTSAQHRIASCVVAFLFAVSTFAVEAQTPPASNAVAASIPAKMLLTTHPLNGRIWDARDKKWVTEAALQKVLRNQRYVLLGETHDNHDHHKRHLQVLKWLATEGEKPALVMEQFDVENQSAMNDAIARGKTAATDFLALADNIAETGKLNKRGWQWPQYRPLVEATVARNAALVAANLSRADARNVYAKGFGAIPAYALPVALAPGLFDTTWNDARQAAVIATMVASHCGHLPAERAPGMVHAQRARDAVMAMQCSGRKKTAQCSSLVAAM